MGFRINTNVPSLQAQTSVGKVARERQESFAKLSSGERITKAADDAAGLAISEKMKAEIRSSKQANRNANDGISLVQVAEGGLNESSSLLTRMRELAIQAASDTLVDSDRQQSNSEYQALKQELERISQATEFNGKKLLDGTGGSLDFQVGIGSNSSDDHITFHGNKLNSGVTSLGVNSVTITSKQGAQESLSKLDSAINQISGHRSTLGSLQNKLISGSNNLQIYTENMSASNSRIRDVDYALETANQAKNAIVESAGTQVLAQANNWNQGTLKLIE
jgi:flagellin